MAQEHLSMILSKLQMKSQISKQLEDSIRVTKGRIPIVKNQLEDLDQTRSVLEQLIESHNQTLSIYNELDSLWFGLKELKLLYQTIDEISIANNIPIGEAG